MKMIVTTTCLTCNREIERVFHQMIVIVNPRNYLLLKCPGCKAINQFSIVITLEEENKGPD